MSLIDPVVTSAIIGLAAVIGGYAVQNFFSGRANRELERFKLKREKYEALVERLAIQIHSVHTVGGKTSDEIKEKFDVIFNTLWLYGSDEVMRYLQTWLSNQFQVQDTTFDKILWSIRKDLMNTKMKDSEVRWFRAI